jgi:hypothetical protein
MTTRATCMLLVLCALAWVGSAFAFAHGHDPATTGIYNADCPLYELAAHQQVPSLPSSAPSIQNSPDSTEASPPALVSFAAPTLRTTDSRAPPLA